MRGRRAAVAALVAGLFLSMSALAASDCGFYNEITLQDPAGDQSAGAPSYVDVRTVQIRQIGQYVQFIWEAGGNPYNDDKQYFFLVFDTDLNANTGQRWGGAGGELKITVSHTASLVYFDAAGNVVKTEAALPVIFEGNRFVLNVPKAAIPADRFNFYFESSGTTPYADRGSTTTITLQPVRGTVRVAIEADQLTLSNPPLIVIPDKATAVQLRAVLVTDGVKRVLPATDVKFAVTHPVRESLVGAPSSIISVDSNGVARYLREGFVFVNAYSTACYLQSEKTVVATGHFYGDARSDRVVAVFPPDFVPEGSVYSFGSMMTAYPNYIRTTNLAYDIESKLYGGYRPLSGETQIYAPMVAAGHCGGNNNPLETAPCCYMECGSGVPQYIVVFHEMGHNFAGARGMSQLLNAGGARIARAGLGECVASLPIIYMVPSFNKNPAKFGLADGSFELPYFRNFLAQDTQYARGRLNDFETMIRSGQITGIFDPSPSLDRVSAFCSFFQTYAYDLTASPNPYHEEMVARFFSLFGDSSLPDFVDAKADTYFAAAFSAAAGNDLRERLRFWGFTIDDPYFDQLYASMTAKLNRLDHRRRTVRP